MSGYQIQYRDEYAGLTVTGTKPEVYKTRWRAWLEVFLDGGWFFGETWYVVPAEPKEEELPPPVVKEVSPPQTFQSKPRGLRRPDPSGISQMYERGAWNCERCGRKNAWGSPSCRCTRSR